MWSLGYSLASYTGTLSSNMKDQTLEGLRIQWPAMSFRFYLVPVSIQTEHCGQWLLKRLRESCDAYSLHAVSSLSTLLLFHSNVSLPAPVPQRHLLSTT